MVNATDPSRVHCTEDDTLPALDALGGAAAIAVAGGGVIIEETSNNELQHFEKYYLAPLLVGSLIYFISTSYGTNRVEQCHAAKGDGVLEQ